MSRWLLLAATLLFAGLAFAQDPAHDAVRDALRAGDAGRALGLLAPLRRANPQDPDLRLLEAQALRATGRPEAALDVLRPAVQSYPDYADLHTLQQALEREIAAPPAGRWIDMVARHDALDRGLADWQALRVGLSLPLADGRRLGLALDRERRFGESAEGADAALFVPLGTRWALAIEAGLRPGATAMARGFADLRVQRQVGVAQFLSVGLRETGYRDADVRRLAFGYEAYRGDWRAAYTLNLTRVDDGATLAGHAFALDRTLADGGQLGLRGAVGRDEVLLAGAVASSRIATLSLGGRHAVTGAWSWTWEAGRLRQEGLYRRDFLQFGLRRAF